MVEHEVQGETKHFVILKKCLQELLTGPCVFTTCPFRCTYLSNGGTFCGPDINDAVITSMY